MGLLQRLSLVLTVAVAACAAVPERGAAAEQVRRPQVTWLKAETNYTPANRNPTSIRYVVVHVTEGSFWGSVAWLQNPRAHASSHYVISREGKIVQLVAEKNVAWHAGNRRMNELSIGIEHEGMTYDPVGFTKAQYHASARLVAYHARRSLLPVDRKHIIGHGEVPHPSDPTRIGGASAHTDPGPYWDWEHYVRLVRKYAFPVKPVRLQVDSTTIRQGQTLSGTVPWRAATKGPRITRVDFLVNGKLVWRDARPPYAAGPGLNTIRLRNGRHTLEVRAYSKGGSWTRHRFAVQVRNAPFELTTAGVRPGAQVSGVVRIRAAVRTAPASEVALWVDGRRAAVARKAPYAFAWDTRKVKPGPHVLRIEAKARDGRVSTRMFRVVVGTPDIPAPVLVGQSVADGQVVSGLVDWNVQLTGRVVRAEFLVDGALRQERTKGPWSYAWDTAAEAPGPRTLTLRLVGPTGKVTEATVTVTVAGG
jgi:N-acetyl-anhydromuramyl-L-alanine amidase AmpD